MDVIWHVLQNMSIWYVAHHTYKCEPICCFLETSTRRCQRVISGRFSLVLMDDNSQDQTLLHNVIKLYLVISVLIEIPLMAVTSCEFNFPHTAIIRSKLNFWFEGNTRYWFYLFICGAGSLNPPNILVQWKRMNSCTHLPVTKTFLEISDETLTFSD